MMEPLALHPRLSSLEPARRVPGVPAVRGVRQLAGFPPESSRPCLSSAAFAAALVLGAPLHQRRRARRRAGCAAPAARVTRLAAKAGGVEIAIGIGKASEAARLKKGKMSTQERNRSRTFEIRRKLDALKGKGGIGDAYKRRRDEEAGKVPSAETAQQAAEAAAEAEEDDFLDGEDLLADGSSSVRMDDRYDGEGVDDWVFDRGDPDYEDDESLSRFSNLAKRGLISNEARAIAEVELEGSGKGIASSRLLLDAAMEFACAEQYEEAAELLEICRPRIDKEQIERKIDNQTAVERDDECMWGLASAYEKDGRLTLAVNAYGILKDRLEDNRARTRATRRWADSSFALAQRLDMVRKFQEAEAVFKTLLECAKDPATKALEIDFIEDVQLNYAMNLQNMWRGAEAIEILLDMKAKTRNKRHRAQASFILDVIQVDTSGERNEEFHKVWEENFTIGTDSYSGGFTSGGGGRVLNLTDRERSFKNWATDYWNDRLSSPLYYAFLTLFVTWPFAIPVVAIFGKESPISGL